LFLLPWADLYLGIVNNKKKDSIAHESSSLFFFSLCFDPFGVVLFLDDDPAWGRPSFFCILGSSVFLWFLNWLFLLFQC